MNMIETVARVLEPQAWENFYSEKDSIAYKNRRTSSLRKARAAIDAMKIPTDEMAVAGQVFMGKEVGSSATLMACAFSAMISKALEGGE